MAAALSFRTLFGLVPVLFVATLAARSLAGENFPKFVESLAEMAGLDEIGIDVVTEGSGTVEKQPLSNWIEELVRFSGTIDLSALGIIGVIVVLFSAIWLIVAIENTFNIVCRSANSRPWHRRILVYWSMLTLGPILLAMLPVLDNELRGFVDDQTTLPTSYVIVRPILGFCLLFLLLFFAYSVIPTVRMRWKTIVTGALVGAIGHDFYEGERQGAKGFPRLTDPALRGPEDYGDYIRMATERGRSVKPGLKAGICGEHGGDPASIAFCETVNLDYVSCSPFRVPIARLAAAQASLSKH